MCVNAFGKMFPSLIRSKGNRRYVMSLVTLLPVTQWSGEGRVGFVYSPLLSSPAIRGGILFYYYCVL